MIHYNLPKDWLSILIGGMEVSGRNSRNRFNAVTECEVEDNSGAYIYPNILFSSQDSLMSTIKDPRLFRIFDKIISYPTAVLGYIHSVH